MPLNEDDFRIAGGDVERTLLDFFKAHRFVAYMAEELLFELGALGVISTPEEVERSLNTLVLRGRLLVNMINGDLYYLYDNSLGLRPPG